MILIKIANFVSEMLDFPQEQIIVGRENAKVEHFENDFIVIDNLTPPTPITTLRKYDGELEVEYFSTLMSAKFTLEFYGQNAYNNMSKFLNLQKAQKTRDLQKKYEISVYKAGSINNLKQIVGSKYFERYEIELLIQYYERYEIDTLRIDSVQLDEFLINK